MELKRKIELDAIE